MKDFEIVDRYDVLGIPRPDKKTMCLGQCEGTGWIPIHGEDETLEEDNILRKLWREAELKNPSDDGWHFVKCPDCKGTGKRMR